MTRNTRTEHDSLGSVEVPVDALYGAQTQRAVDNFQISDLHLPDHFITSLAQIKVACARTNAELGLLDKEDADAIVAAADRIIAGECADQFPVDLFQTGSGTSTNMNMNEVLSALVKRDSGRELHPNDHINMSQSSNDVIPTCIHVSALLLLDNQLLPALRHLIGVLTRKRSAVSHIVKTGRTHLMDAMPIRMDQEISGWLQQAQDCVTRLENVRPRLVQVAQGGTAVGTGINAPKTFSRLFCRHLSVRTALTLQPAQNHFALQSSQDTAVELSGQLKTCATMLMKIANDLRWMNSGPLAGLGEIALPTLQPGSSIMPGKVNPVIPEAVMMAAAQVCGNDTSITLCAQHGNFQLNTMLPLIAYNLLQSEMLVTNAARALAEKAISGFTVNKSHIEATLARNPVLVTALNRVLGYEQAAKLAKQAYAEGRPIIDVVVEHTDLEREEVEQLLNPRHLTGAE
ncbi:MAG: class II fumarate hydratase [Oceanospirillales bacterium]|uniref:Fumarate hydratase class II n=1 Tax=Marinobacterium halophilum TaxID=267374 RepID=A0A2P8ESR3_9GAMM|nr:class II fumarate hydratase [Marinobacterium halophilum]MBR9828288.1 class II fumarate hydratase [Oceanospirillales bacterium]PSL12494.1 fumarase class II [Marinobacterium halophilum]